VARIDQKAFYVQNYETYGVSAEGAAWDSAHTQQRRFSALLSSLGEIRYDTIVDAGCGFGDFYLYLKTKNRLPKQYIGLDLCAHMVKEAKVRTRAAKGLSLICYGAERGKVSFLTGIRMRS